MDSVLNLFGLIMSETLGSPLLAGVLILGFLSALTLWRKNFVLFLLVLSVASVTLVEAGFIPEAFKALAYGAPGLIIALGLLRIVKI